MNTGGAETFLMKVYRCINRDEYQMDFLLNSKENFYGNEINAMGGRIFYAVPKSKDPIKSFLTIKNIVKKEKYDCVLRVGEHSLASLDLLAAKMGKATRLAQRSSNDHSASKIGTVLHYLFNFMPRKIPNIKIAPSLNAARYTFGKKMCSKNEVNILNNGVDISRFSFSEKIRRDYRQKLQLKDKVVFGHVGRFSEQKNHSYLIKVFDEIVKKNPDARLLLIGNGELEDKIKQQINDVGISDKVILLGTRADVEKLFMAMDGIIFPSLYEGLPNVIVEAQATGLPCIISDTITDEVILTEDVFRYSIQLEPVIWADKALQMINNSKRENAIGKIIENGYDIQETAGNFIKIIFGD